jgi:hypothetical protein
MAPCFAVPTDNVLASQLALVLLRRTAQLQFAKWEIGTYDDADWFYLNVDLLAQTLDDEELSAALTALINESAAFKKELQKTNIDF